MSNSFKNLAASLRSLSMRTSASPAQVFGWFVTAHLLLWTFFPAITSPNAPLDVIEGYGWGHEWVMGTYKHPPLQAWILEILALLTGRAFWAHFFISQVAVVIAFWAVWQTGRRIMGEKQALIGVLLLEGVIYYNFTSTEFNPNVLQLTFWALAGWSFHRAVKEHYLLDWLLLGVWSAAGLYTKYSTALLLAVFVVLIIQRPEARRCLKKPGPYLAVLVASLLFLPHMLWLTHHDFLPFTYVKDRLIAPGPATKFVTPPAFFPTFLLSPIVFTVGQILAMLPAILLFLTLDGQETGSGKLVVKDKFDRAFLVAITFAPMTLTLFMAIGFGFKIHDMWGAPFFNFAGLWAVMTFYPSGAIIRPRFTLGWLILFVVTALGVATANFLLPFITEKPGRLLFPGEELAKQISEGWHKQYTSPLAYAVGDTWPAGNVAYYAPERPHLFINGDTVISPWINMDDVKKQGAVVVWCELHCSRSDDDSHKDGKTVNKPLPDYMHTIFPEAIIQKSLEIPRQTDADVFPITFGWAIVPPAMVPPAAPSHQPAP